MFNSKGREYVRGFNERHPDNPLDLRPRFKEPTDSRLYPYLSEGFIPCGKCLGCLLDKRESWTVRACLELLDYADNASFVTLTYDDAHLPVSGENGLPSLVKRDLQCFFKRLRSKLDYECKTNKLPKIKVRYFACGEYGSKFDRPHYHAILYGFLPNDLQYWSMDGTTFRSPFLEDCWKLGFSTISPANFTTCRYVAGYVGKKIFGTPPEGVEPVFTLTSQNPAIGKNWFKRYGYNLVKFRVDENDKSHLVDHKVLLPDGKPAHIPQAFLRWWREAYPEKHELLLSVNEASPLDVPTQEELAARATYHELLLKSSSGKGVTNV